MVWNRIFWSLSVESCTKWQEVVGRHLYGSGLSGFGGVAYRRGIADNCARGAGAAFNMGGYGHAKELLRSKIGEYSVDDSFQIEEFAEEWKSLEI